MKRILVLFLCLIAGFLVIGCAMAPVTGKREFVLMSEEEEISIGQKLNPEIIKQYGYYSDPVLQEYVNQLGKKIAQVSHRSDLIFHFKIIDTPVINAFALPGGYIYINRGILAQINSEAELSCILGHEIGHVAARHAVKQITKARAYQIGALAASIFVPEVSRFQDLFDIVTMAVLQGYGRKNEFQADQLGQEYAFKAGYNPQDAVSFFQTLKRIESESENKRERSFLDDLFASHPPLEERIKKDIERTRIFLASGEKEVVSLPNQYKSQLDGLLYGDDPKNGVIEDNVFKHRDLRFELTFPEDWKITNEKNKVWAKHPQKEWYVTLTQHDLAKRISPEKYAKKRAKKVGLKIVSGKTIKINYLSAFVGRGRRDSFFLKFAYIFKGDKVYCLGGRAPRSEFGEVEKEFTKAIFSFRELSVSEAKEIKAARIKVYTIKKGDTLQSIAQKELGDIKKAKDIAMLNGLQLETSLKEGDKLKLIIYF
jgi:predicted Zn-dependent protease